MSGIWIDLLNPSHPHFFKAIHDELMVGNTLIYTARERGETVKLARRLGLNPKVIGVDHEGRFRKTFNYFLRTQALAFRVKDYDTSIGFENPMTVYGAKVRRKRSILLLDNDIKYKVKGSIVQSLESKVKMAADHIIVPESCRGTLSKNVTGDRLITYDGYKEDIYLADFEPSDDFLSEVPFKEYYVIRPESLASFYVEGEKSLLPSLVQEFIARGENVIVLPRDRSDRRDYDSGNVFVPAEPLNGLDLIYNSKGVLTGSGTMAREAAVMGRPAVSFFPNSELLSVDQDLIDKGRMIHSRDIKEIFGYLDGSPRSEPRDSKKAKAEVVGTILSLIDGGGSE